MISTFINTLNDIANVIINFTQHVGDYFVVGMDIEQYDAADPGKYLKGLLHSEQEPWVGEAYRSYLAVLPSPTVGFDDFSRKVTAGGS